MFVNPNLPVHPNPAFPLGIHVRSLHLCLYGCFANKVSYTIFRDSTYMHKYTLFSWLLHSVWQTLLRALLLYLWFTLKPHRVNATVDVIPTQNYREGCHVQLKAPGCVTRSSKLMFCVIMTTIVGWVGTWSLCSDLIVFSLGVSASSCVTLHRVCKHSVSFLIYRIGV